MEAEDEIPRCRTLLCAVQTGGKYFGKLLQNMCENTVHKTFYNVLDENFYKHDILHLWKNDKCCLCGVSTVHHYAGSLKQRQILSVYSAIDRKCGRILCKFCPCSYKAKEGVCTSNIDITFSHALLSRVFLKSVHPSLPTCNVRRAIDEIKEIRNTAVHYPENPLHKVDFDKEWLNLKSSLLIICKYLKESTDMLEEEMEKFHYLVNTCKDCSFRIKASLERMKNGELKDSNDNGIIGNSFQMFAVCQECARIQEGCKDAQSLIFDNLHLFMGLTPYEFLPDLEEAGALTEEEVRHIKSLDKRAKQMEAFLSILKERGISSCRKTLDILAEKDYGPAIREMRKEKKAGCDITFAVNGNFDVEEVNALQQKTKDHTTEQSSGIGKYDLRFSVLGPRKDKIEKILKDFIESEDFSCKLKDMGPEDISVTNGSVIVHVTFKCQEDYDKFSVAVSEGKLFDIVSRMWDEVKWKHQINKQDASMIVYIQNVPGRLADSGKTECSAAFFIDTNNEFLTEELCSGTLIKYLKESHRDISEAIRIRKEHPFDRRAQSQELLKFLRNESFEFIQKCIFATQPETVKRKLEEFMSSVHAVLETENKEKETMVEDTLLQTGRDDIIREKHAVLETEDKEKETMVEDTLLQTGTDAIINEKEGIIQCSHCRKRQISNKKLEHVTCDACLKQDHAIESRKFQRYTVYDDNEDDSNLSYKTECKPLFVQHDIPQRQSKCEVMENEAPVQNNFECDTNNDLAAAPVLNINSLKNPPRTDSAADEPIIFASDEPPSLLSSPSFHEEMMPQSEDDNKDNLQKMNSNDSFSMKYQKIPKFCDFNKYDTPSELRLSMMEEVYKEKPNMAQPADHDDGKTRCTVTIQNFMDYCEKAVDVLTKLGYKLDLDNLNPAKTWKGFAKAKLNYDDDRINATAHHTKGNPSNGHFMSLLDDMLASGLTLGDIVEYFSMEESRRDDVLGLIFENHSLCPFCDRYRKRLKDI